MAGGGCQMISMLMDGAARRCRYGGRRIGLKVGGGGVDRNRSRSRSRSLRRIVDRWSHEALRQR